LISRAFTPRVVETLQPRITMIARRLLDAAMPAGQMDFATDYAVPLAMTVIAELIGIPAEDGTRFRHWSDVILSLSYTRSGGADAERAGADFRAVADEMREYLARMIADRRKAPRDDLLTRLVQAEVDGARLSEEEILGFFNSWWWPARRLPRTS
jgi:cytochrome P450